MSRIRLACEFNDFDIDMTTTDALNFRRFALKKYMKDEYSVFTGYLVGTPIIGDGVERYTVINIHNAENMEYVTDHVQLDFNVDYNDKKYGLITVNEFNPYEVGNMIKFKAKVSKYDDHKYGLQLVDKPRYNRICSFVNCKNLALREYDINTIVTYMNEQIEAMDKKTLISKINKVLDKISYKSSLPDKFIKNYVLNTLTLNTRLVAINNCNINAIFNHFDKKDLERFLSLVSRILYISSKHDRIEISKLLKVITIMIMNYQNVRIEFNKETERYRVISNDKFKAFVDKLGFNKNTISDAKHAVNDLIKNFDMTTLYNDPDVRDALSGISLFITKQLLFEIIF